jgi:hypothetical protein
MSKPPQDQVPRQRRTAGDPGRDFGLEPSDSRAASGVVSVSDGKGSLLQLVGEIVYGSDALLGDEAQRVKPPARYTHSFVRPPGSLPPQPGGDRHT